MIVALLAAAAGVAGWWFTHRNSAPAQLVLHGNVDLRQVANTVTSTFAASNTAAGAFVRFLDTSGFTVGTVAADVCAAGDSGEATPTVHSARQSVICRKLMSV